ncbi:unnamed protein product [Prorocentrum cordatum]|uniref:Uncharacterized protein n=1 Tax=Prorocentrum cordatum TaxID=2364126 RepID=A0ABN9S0T9_9DINO|nr:unnamed protein product [Polarella glacialis]
MSTIRPWWMSVCLGLVLGAQSSTSPSIDHDHMAALQRSMSMSKKVPLSLEAKRQPCLSVAKQETKAASSLRLRLAHLEATSKAQHRRLGQMRLELTGEEPAGRNSTGLASQPARAAALDGELSLRADAIAELLSATRKATARLEAKALGCGAQCAAVCAGGGAGV